MDYEEAIEKVYGKGMFSKLLTLCMAFQTIILAFEFESIVFLVYAPEFICTDEQLGSNSVVTWITESDYVRLVEHKNYPFSSHQNYTIDQCYAAIGNETSDLHPFACSKFSYDQTTMHNTIVTNYDLVCKKKIYASWLSSATLMAVAVGHFLAVFTDRFSRRKVLLFYMGMDIFWSVITPFAPNIEVVFVYRIGRMLSAPLCYYAACLLYEILPAKKRSAYGNWYWAPFTIGYIGSAGLAYLTKDWKLFRLYGLLGFVGYIPLFVLLPESPRWLCLNGKFDEYRKTLIRLAKWNGVSLSEDFFDNAVAGVRLKQMALPRETDSIASCLAETCTLSEDIYGPEERRDNILNMFRSPNMRCVLLAFCVQMASVSVCYYGLSTNAGFASDNVFLNVFYMGLSEAPASAVGWLLCHYLNRRESFLLSAIFVIPSIPIGSIIRPYSSIANTLIISIGKLMVTVQYHICLLHIAEFFPTTVRNMGLFLVMAFGCTVSGLSPFINDLYAVYSYLPGIIYAALNVFASIVVFIFLPNTKNCPLAQTISQAELLRRGKEKEWIEFMRSENNQNVS